MMMNEMKNDEKYWKFIQEIFDASTLLRDGLAVEE